MTFLNPFILLGLAAAAIPILIHLLNKRKLRTIDFSTLTFLKELQKNTMRKITIRQWLLLLLRTLIIIFLVLAFSRPALEGTVGSFESQASSSLVIIIDNTASMAVQNDRGSYMMQAQEQARAIISMMKERDDASIIRLSDVPSPAVEVLTRDKAKLTSVVQGTEAAALHRTIVDGIRTAEEILRSSKNINKEIYIITDGQLTTLSDNKKIPDRMKDGWIPRCKVFYTFIADRSFDNFAIENIVIPPAIFIPGKPAALNVVVKNFGGTALSNHLISVTLGNSRVAQKNISLHAGETSTVEFSVTPQTSGFISGFVETEDDNFTADNKRYFSFYIPEQVRALVVAPSEKYSRYITTAFSAAPTGAAGTPITVTTAAPSQLTSNLISSHDVLILSGVTQLAESYGRLLNESYKSGKGILFFPSADTVNDRYEYLQAFGIRGIRVVRMRSTLPATIEKIDFDFPVFQGMFESTTKKVSEVESPDVSVSLAIDRSASLQSIITLSNGNPLLWESGSQEGRVIGFSVPAADDWSTLPYKGLFVTLLYQSTLYLSSRINIHSTESEYFTGERPSFSPSLFRFKESKRNAPLNVFDPNARELTMAMQHAPVQNGTSARNFSVDGVTIPGIYTIRSGNDTVFAFAANIPGSESDGTVATGEQRDALFASLGIPSDAVTPLPIGGTVKETILQSRYGLELWKYFLVAALIFALIEMIVAREKKDS
jgi:hypothetical protein